MKLLSEAACLIFPLLGFTACGQVPTIDPSFEGLISTFESKLGRSIRSEISVEFIRPANPSAYAVCHDGHEIQVSAERWASIESEFYRRAILFHELGHCLANLQHDDSFIPDPKHPGSERPKTLMHSTPVSYPYSEDPDYYDNELINRIRKALE